MHKIKKVFLLSVVLLQGCAVERLSKIGEDHKLSQIHNPTQLAGYSPVSMPMPHPYPEPKRINSLWQTGSKAFFKDQRANKVGDIITISIDIDQEQSIEVNPSISKSTSNDVNVDKALGYEYKAQQFFPKKQKVSAPPLGSSIAEMARAVQPQWLKYSSNPNLNGTGKYEMKDSIQFKLAATVIQVLANGNMVVQGRSEVKLANEVREVEVRGIIRREDIGSSNVIKSEKIAELRINYGGRGDLSDLNEIPWGQQIASKVLPF